MSKITDKKISHAFLIEFIILGAIGIFIFSSHAYQDFCETMRHGLTVWDALFDGKLIDFMHTAAVIMAASTAEATRSAHIWMHDMILRFT